MTQLNQNTCRPCQALDAISSEYPGIWKYVDLIRAARGKEFKTWPDVCFLPINSIYRTVKWGSGPVTENQIATEIFRISSLAAWRITQGIYRFDADVYEAVRDTPIESNFPWKALCNFPEWCIYIETPNLSLLQENIHGVWIHIDWDADCQTGALCILLDSKHQFPLVLHLNDETVLGSVDLAKSRILSF